MQKIIIGKIVDKLKELVSKTVVQALDEKHSRDPFKAFSYTRDGLRDATDKIFEAENEAVQIKNSLKDFANQKRNGLNSDSDVNSFMKVSSWCESLPSKYQLSTMLDACEKIKKEIPKLHEKRLKVVWQLKKSLKSDIDSEKGKLTEQLELCDCKPPCKMTEREKFACAQRLEQIEIHLRLDSTNLSMVKHYDRQLKTEIDNLANRVILLHKIYKDMSDKIAETDSLCVEIKKKKMRMQGFKIN